MVFFCFVLANPGEKLYTNLGKCVPKNEDYDLLQLVIIRLGSSEYSGMEYDLFRFLTALFYPHKPGFRSDRELYRFQWK